MAGNRSGLWLAVAVTLLLLLTGGAVLTGAVDLPGTDGTAAPATPAAGTAADTALPVGSRFTLVTRDIEDCGMLCRSVTSTLTNERSEPAHDVTIRTQLYAGNGTASDVRWRHVERVGTLGGGENYTVTRQVELPLDAALAIRRADGWVTVRTVVGSEDRRTVVVDRRQVD